MLDVVCVGSATVDNFVSMKGSFSKLKSGAKILAYEYEVHSGGGATNAAAALSSLGLKTGIICKVGDDHDGDLILNELKKFKIKILNKNRSKHHTDNSTLVSSYKDKDRIILVHKEASSDLTKTDLQNGLKTNKRWYYIGSLMGMSEKTIISSLKNMKKKGEKIIFNPSQYMAAQGIKKLKPFLKNSDILILNKEEARLLLKDKKSDTKKLLLKLFKQGPKNVVITNSKNKVYAYSNKKFYSLVPPKIKIKDTAGAGDAFNSGLLAGIIKGYDIKKSIELGQVMSSYVIQSRGTKNKLLNESQAKRAIKRLKIVCKEC